MLSYVYTLFKFPGEYASCPPLFVKVHLNNKFYFIKQVSTGFGDHSTGFGDFPRGSWLLGLLSLLKHVLLYTVHCTAVYFEPEQPVTRGGAKGHVPPFYPRRKGTWGAHFLRQKRTKWKNEWKKEPENKSKKENWNKI